MPLEITISDRVKRWFFKSMVTALAAAIIGFGGWFIGSHMTMRETVREQHAHIQNLEESNTAQWRIIAELQTKVATLDKNSGVVQTIQTELVLPHFLGRVNQQIDPYTPFENIEEPAELTPLEPMRLEEPEEIEQSNPFEQIESNQPDTEEELRYYDLEQRHLERAR